MNSCAAASIALTLWGVESHASRLTTSCRNRHELATRYVCNARRPDMRPVRWLLQTPERRAANRPPRATPSIVALLTALRNALGAERGNKLTDRSIGT